MKYSVLMSVYYKENPEFLRIAIQSMLAQTIIPEEFILVKDGPLTSELEAEIKKFELNNPGLFTFITNETNLGLGPALRKGVEASKNEIIIRMDSDDYSVPFRCEKLLNIFNLDKELGMVGSYEVEFANDIHNIVAIHKVPETNDEIEHFMRRRCAILHPTVAFKKSEVIRAGNYQQTSEYPIYEDYDLFSRMVFETHVKCYNIQDNLYYIRTSEDFYKRRGGIEYAKTILRFKWHLHKRRHMSLGDFLVSGLGQAFVCVIPNKLRKLYYMKFLRR